MTMALLEISAHCPSDSTRYFGVPLECPLAAPPTHRVGTSRYEVPTKLLYHSTLVRYSLSPADPLKHLCVPSPYSILISPKPQLLFRSAPSLCYRQLTTHPS